MIEKQSKISRGFQFQFKMLFIISLLMNQILNVEATNSDSWTYHEVYNNSYGATSVFAIDIDGDGDIDLTSASAFDNTIAWYENTNIKGDGSTWAYHEVYTQADRAEAIFAIDIDGDGDIDLVSASLDYNTIAWHENMNGNGLTWTYHEVNTLLNGATSVFAIDIDGDGDIDLASANVNNDTIAWHENTNINGDGSTWAYHEVFTQAKGATSVFAIDIDGDGDIDLASTNGNDDTIAWYENTNSNGDGSTWAYHRVYRKANGAWAIFGIDIDGDGDIDLASANSNTIAWYENVNGDGSTWTYYEVYAEVNSPWSIFGIDMDGDGDTDLASASIYDNTIAWSENTNINGDGSSWLYHEVYTQADGAASVFAIDIDGDGDIDLASASLYDSTIAWYEVK